MDALELILLFYTEVISISSVPYLYEWMRTYLVILIHGKFYLLNISVHLDALGKAANRLAGLYSVLVHM